MKSRQTESEDKYRGTGSAAIAGQKFYVASSSLCKAMHWKPDLQQFSILLGNFFGWTIHDWNTSLPGLLLLKRRLNQRTNTYSLNLVMNFFSNRFKQPKLTLDFSQWASDGLYYITFLGRSITCKLFSSFCGRLGARVMVSLMTNCWTCFAKKGKTRYFEHLKEQ